MVEIAAALLPVAIGSRGSRLGSTYVWWKAFRSTLALAAAATRCPLFCVSRQFPAAGVLVSYGPDLADSYRQTGVLTGKILKGAYPADLPVEQ